MKRIWTIIVLQMLLALACGGGAPTDSEANLPATVQALEATMTAQAGATAAAPPRPTLSAPTPDPNAPTFYVATDGNDEGGDGSAAAPWATITHALDSVGDGSLILVRAGLYTGRVRIRGQFAQGVTVRSEIPYQALLRADETVLTIFEAQGITLEGFDVAHASAAAEAIVVQIQDLLGEAPGGAEFTSRITLRNNILHDSYNNDILKINNGAQQILVSGNVFYNQGDSDEHIDINSVRDVVVEDNLFFNAFGASGRPVTSESSSFVVAKDSNGDEDGIVGTAGLTIRRNVFLHYEGSVGHNMVLLGEDGNAYFEVSEVLIENNLFLGDGAEIRAPFGTKGVHNVVFRHNTITGDMPGGAFAWRTNVEGDNQPNDNIQLYNNLFSDPTGTMNNFATAPAGETAAFSLANNVYWNGGQPLPGGGEDMVQKIQEGWTDYEAVIATPDMMKSAGRLGKVLGPRGLMPNPKTGTVTFEVAKAVAEIKAGKVEFRVDKTGIVHSPVGKISFEAAKLAANAQALLAAVIKAKPAAAKGKYVKRITLTSTMGPGINVDLDEAEAATAAAA